MSQVILYQSEDGRTKLDVRLEGQTVWLSQKQLTELFGKAKGTISEYIKHIFEDGELVEDSVVRFFRTTAADGKEYEVAHYNLDMVLALGFRVRSPMAVRFRQWAADKLKEYITKGFVLDDERLKNPQAGNDYFEELTRRIQDIRTSERRFYQKITDIFLDRKNPTTAVTRRWGLGRGLRVFPGTKEGIRLRCRRGLLPERLRRALSWPLYGST
jgi:hypothetical protein